MNFTLTNLTGKKFKEIADFKWVIFTDKPSTNRYIIDFQKKFNTISRKYLEKYMTAESCEEYLLQIDSLFAEYVEVLRENDGHEVASKACKIKDALYTIYDVFTKGTPHEEAGKIGIVISNQRRSFATKFFQTCCQTVETFDEWFKALSELREEMKELYRVTDYSQANISLWSTDTWILHTSFLMLCYNTDEDVREYAKNYWDCVMEEFGLDWIRQNPWNVIHHICEGEADKEYVMQCLNLDETIN